jgi:hypothetical protein
MKKNDQAFPVGYNGHKGMTRRDYFAAHAPQPPDRWREGEMSLTDVISWRWWYADQMIRMGEE